MSARRARLAEDVADAQDRQRLHVLSFGAVAEPDPVAAQRAIGRAVSRITTTLMWPGYCISASIRLEMSLASW